jgi:hypothetical protein
MLNVILASLLGFATAAPNFDPRWKSCATDADCVRIPSFCTLSTSINKTYVKENVQYVAAAKKAVRCHHPPKELRDFLKKAVPVCIEKTCKLASPDKSKVM